jgi:hypothetical protein
VYVHGRHGCGDVGKGAVAVVQQVGGGLVFRKGVAKLLGGPRRRGMVGDRYVNEPSTVVREDDQHEKQPERDGRHDERVSGHDLVRVAGQERPSRL